jgi:hypothetical protein
VHDEIREDLSRLIGIADNEVNLPASQERSNSWVFIRELLREARDELDLIRGAAL